jgi:hypothetical protein
MPPPLVLLRIGDFGGWLARVASSSCVVGLYTYERLRVNGWAGRATGLKLWPFLGFGAFTGEN